jgi:hypothetical protein
MPISSQSVALVLDVDTPTPALEIALVGVV